MTFDPWVTSSQFGRRYSAHSLIGLMKWRLWVWRYRDRDGGDDGGGGGGGRGAEMK